ncbi:MAG: hypothetical protein HW421_4047 [Ignavibacteria bacterium]|nr:hypothetical protein [Ignavibacteria bacterium]
MKNFVLILSLCLLFISQDVTFAQKKGKKIETWELIHRGTSFNYCGNNCIDKVWIRFQNNSSYHVSTIILKLRIYTPDNTTIYKRKHSIQIDLDPGEIGASKKFSIYELVVSDYGFEGEGEGGCDFDIEILSVK